MRTTRANGAIEGDDGIPSRGSWTEWSVGRMRAIGVALVSASVAVVVVWLYLESWPSGPRRRDAFVLEVLAAALVVVWVLLLVQRFAAGAGGPTLRRHGSPGAGRAARGGCGDRTSVQGPWRLGSYDVNWYKVLPGFITFSTSAPGVDAITCFAYSEGGALRESRCQYVFDLGGSWYAFGGKGCPWD